MKLLSKFFLAVLLLTVASVSWGACPEGTKNNYKGECLPVAGSETAGVSDALKVAEALAGIDIENDPNIAFFKPPIAPTPTKQLYWFGRMWKEADFNNDGITDVLYIGTMNPNNAVSGGEDTGDICGTKACSGFQPLPS